MISTRVILWRHGLTDFNAENRFQGQLDVPLNEQGEAQARSVAEALVGWGITAVYSSPLTRALRTAEQVADRLGVKIGLDHRLEEINVGSWAGRTLDELVQANPQFARAMACGEDFRRSPEGETAIETGQRMARALEHIAERHGGETVLVVSHGLAIRMGVAELLGCDYRLATTISIMDNCAWSVMNKLDRGWRLVSWNIPAPVC